MITRQYINKIEIISYKYITLQLFLPSLDCRRRSISNQPQTDQKGYRDQGRQRAAIKGQPDWYRERVYRSCKASKIRGMGCYDLAQVLNF